MAGINNVGPVANEGSVFVVNPPSKPKEEVVTPPAPEPEPEPEPEDDVI